MTQNPASLSAKGLTWSRCLGGRQRRSSINADFQTQRSRIKELPSIINLRQSSIIQELVIRTIHPQTFPIFKPILAVSQVQDTLHSIYTFNRRWQKILLDILRAEALVCSQLHVLFVPQTYLPSLFCGLAFDIYCLSASNISQNRSYDSLIQQPSPRRPYASPTRGQGHRY